jgi:cytidylate kinase
MIITIDGPAGTGKSTVAKRVAAILKLPYFDTGAMYRAVAVLMLHYKISLSDKPKISELLKTFRFSIKDGRCFANGTDVTAEIRSSAVNNIVSPIAALSIVRETLWEIQRRFAKERGGVFEGRDLGTVAFPNAKIKVFLTAKPEIRAQRRLDEILQKRPHEGAEMDRDKMLEELKKRDEYDSTRMLAPLKCAPDAYVIDTSALSIDEVVDRILEYKRKKNLRPTWMHLSGVKILYRFVLFSAWTLAKVLYRHKVYGLEHFYPRGAILASNHTSFLDPPLLSISWPEEVHFLARQSLFHNRFFGAFIRAINSHPVSGDAGDVAVFRTICDLLEEGKKVVLFPEGTRSLDGALQPMKPGIGLLLSRTKAAVIPAYLDGPYRIWSRHRKFPKLFGKTTCVFGSPITWDSFSHLGKREAHEAITQKLSESITALKTWLENGANGIPP